MYQVTAVTKVKWGGGWAPNMVYGLTTSLLSPSS